MQRVEQRKLAWIYYREMVHHGKNHKQAMGAVMSHLAARVLTVLREGRPYELRDAEGRPISREKANELLSRYRVPEEVRRDKRRRNPAKGTAPRKRAEGMASHRTSEAAGAPQSVATTAIPPAQSIPPQPRGQCRLSF